MHRGMSRAQTTREGRLNIITHLLSQVPYEKPARPEIVLPERQERGDYKEPKYASKFIDERY